MTKVLELPEEVAKQLEDEAQAMKIAPDQWALIKLQRRASVEEKSSAIGDEKWRGISRGVIDDNRELLERLAR